MYNREGKNKAGERLALSIDEEGQSFRVLWNGLCGYGSVEFSFATKEQAIAFYEAALNVEEYDPD